MWWTYTLKLLLFITIHHSLKKERDYSGRIQGKVGVYLDISGLPGEGGRVQGWRIVAPPSPLEYPLQEQGWSGRR